MAINDADQAESDGLDGGDESTGGAGDAQSDGPVSDSEVRVGEYTWREFMQEYGFEDEVTPLYRNVEESSSKDSSRMGLGTSEGTVQTVPEGDDWANVDFDPETYLGVHPDDLTEYITEEVAPNAKWLQEAFMDHVDPSTTPVVKDEWSWEHFKWQYYYADDGSRPRDGSGAIEEFDETEYIDFSDDEVEGVLSQADDFAQELADVVEERTVNVRDDIEEDEFFSDAQGHTTVVNRYDLEKAVPFGKKTHFREEERYWVNKPYAFVIIFLSEKENEVKYYVIQPYMNELERDLEEFMTGKLRTAIKYSDENVAVEGDEDKRREVIDRETKRLLKRYDLFKGKTASATDSGATSGTKSIVQSIQRFFGTAENTGHSTVETDGEDAEDGASTTEQPATADGTDAATEATANGGTDVATTEPQGGLASAGDSANEGGYGRELDGIKARPEPIILEEDPETLNEYQAEKLLYFLKRDFIGYERIDPIKHDINVEDISCNGYNSPIFVYHGEYEQIITNIYHGERELDDFVVKLAQRSGKGISKRRPQVDATLPDGSRSQLTLGKEVSDHGTNYTIRQFNDVPFTPIDLINWNTFSLDEMAFLWLCIENHKSLIFAGGTASGKTTSLNAISLFIPSNGKIVSIEDTREVELPQRNWIASVTRPSFSEDSQGDVDEFDLLEAALRQRPDYIVMGEIRGEEGRTLFQVMSTGHTTYTTFHADSVGEVLKRFTTDPINVSKTMFTALDLVSIQTQTRVGGHKVRRNRNITEINHYDAENDEINVQDVYQWQAETDEFLKMGESNTLDEIKFDRGWGQEKLDDELFKRRVILAYLIKNGLNTYAEVAATAQAFINDPETILALIANDQLEESLQDLREMESVLIDVDAKDEELVPRPDPDDETFNLAQDILERAEESMFEEYRGKIPSGLASALSGVESQEDVDPTEVVEGDDDEFDFGSTLDDMGGDDGFVLGEDEEDDDFSFGDEADESGPSWLSDDGGGFTFGDDDDPFGGSSDDTAAEAESAEADAAASSPDRPELEAGDSDAARDAATTADTDNAPSAAGGPAGAAGDASEEPEVDASAESASHAGAPDTTDEPAIEDGEAGDIDAEFPELTDADAEADAAEADVESDTSDAEGAGTVDDDGEGAIFGEGTTQTDTDSVFEAVEEDEDDEEESFFGDDDEPFFDEDDEESIFGDSGTAVFDPDDDGSVFGENDDGPVEDEPDQPTDEDSVFGSSDGTVFDGDADADDGDESTVDNAEASDEPTEDDADVGDESTVDNADASDEPTEDDADDPDDEGDDADGFEGTTFGGEEE